MGLSFKKLKPFRAMSLPVSTFNFWLLMNLFLPKKVILFLITCKCIQIGMIDHTQSRAHIVFLGAWCFCLAWALKYTHRVLHVQTTFHWHVNWKEKAEGSFGPKCDGLLVSVESWGPILHLGSRVRKYSHTLMCPQGLWTESHPSWKENAAGLQGRRRVWLPFRVFHSTTCKD